MKTPQFYIAITLACLTQTGCDLLDDLPVGKGFTAKYMCSYIFNSGLDEELVKNTFVAPKVQPLPWIWEVNVDREHQLVNVRDVFFKGGTGSISAIYRHGKGCTLLVDSSADEVDALPFKPAQAPALKPSIAWPYGAAGFPKQPVAGVDYPAVQQAVASAFEESYSSPVNTTSVLVAYDGKLIAERYAHGVNAHTPLLGWSMTKSITGTLAGILIQQGAIGLDDPAPIESWQTSDKKFITLRHLLNMSSGLEVNEDYSGFSDVTQMLYREGDQYAYATSQPIVTPPNQVFQYSTAETNRLAAAIQHVVGDTQQQMYDFYQTQFFYQIDITEAFIEFDAKGHFVGGAYGFMPARDWARIGQLYLQNGQWNNKTILSPQWIAFATAPSPQADYYGAQLWLNSHGNRWPNVPHDAYFFAGHQGQRVVVIPSKKLVVVRTGVTESRPQQTQLMATLLEGIINAIP